MAPTDQDRRSRTHDELREALLGARFPGGHVRFASHEAWLGNHAMRSPTGNEHLQPVWLLVAGLRGMGLTIRDLLSKADFPPDGGVMFGEMTMDIEVPLREECDYQVSGGITDFVRKGGARTGPFDILTFELRVADPDGAECGTVTNSFILPRRKA